MSRLVAAGSLLWSHNIVPMDSPLVVLVLVADGAAPTVVAFVSGALVVVPVVVVVERMLFVGSGARGIAPAIVVVVCKLFVGFGALVVAPAIVVVVRMSSGARSDMTGTPGHIVGSP